jgi:hypothetical protein
MDNIADSIIIGSPCFCENGNAHTQSEYAEAPVGASDGFRMEAASSASFRRRLAYGRSDGGIPEGPKI